ncbi:MAG: head-tail adaptor protein [Staphylococcus equorum]|nr:head-tail adaptor protein [Staphylococcus equorum]
MNLNDLDYRVTFYNVVNDGPEAGMKDWEAVYSCFASLYEPTQKDVQLGNLEVSNRSVTLNIRDAQPQFIPNANQVFEIQNGMYAGLFFNIKNVAPAKTPRYVKVVGEEE